MGTQTKSLRTLLSWQLVLALSGGAWVLCVSVWRIGLAAAVTLMGEAPGAPPAFLPALLLVVCAFAAVGAARLVLLRPMTLADFIDAKDPGPALGAALTLCAGMFLAAAIGLVAALNLGVMELIPGTPKREVSPYAEPALYVFVWLLPACLVKLIDWFGRWRDRQAQI